MYEVGSDFNVFTVREESDHDHCLVNAFWKGSLYSLWYILLINTSKCPIILGSLEKKCIVYHLSLFIHLFICSVIQ